MKPKINLPVKKETPESMVRLVGILNRIGKDARATGNMEVAVESEEKKRGILSVLHSDNEREEAS